jgi:hypothetical protein
MSTTSLILDFETLDTSPTSVITEIGCIAVHRSDFVVFDKLDLRPHILHQIADGRTYSQETFDWHKEKQTFPEHDGNIHLSKAVQQLYQFITRHNPVRIWAWGKDFERSLLENIYRSHDIIPPQYQFRTFTCARDHYMTAFGLDARPEKPNTHHALQDCIDELPLIHAALKELNRLPAF